eukprot:gene2919-574_t
MSKIVGKVCLAGHAPARPTLGATPNARNPPQLVLTTKPGGKASASAKASAPPAKPAFGAEAKSKASFGDEEERKEAEAREEKMRKMMDEVHAANAPHVKQLAEAEETSAQAAAAAAEGTGDAAAETSPPAAPVGGGGPAPEAPAQPSPRHKPYPWTAPAPAVPPLSMCATWCCLCDTCHGSAQWKTASEKPRAKVTKKEKLGGKIDLRCPPYLSCPPTPWDASRHRNCSAYSGTRPMVHPHADLATAPAAVSSDAAKRSGPAGPATGEDMLRPLDMSTGYTEGAEMADVAEEEESAVPPDAKRLKQTEEASG